MEKLIEALTKLLPEDQLQQIDEIKAAVEQELSSYKEELEKEYNAKLDEAYEQLQSEIKETEDTATKGYQEAHTIIEDLRRRLQTQQNEFEATMHEEYEEAYKVIEEERKKNETIEEDLYSRFENDLTEMKSYMVEKITDYLEFKNIDIYENARRDILNDPRLVEHKVVLDRITNELSDYIDHDQFAIINSNKIEEATKENETLRSTLRRLEAKNINLDTRNKKLDEAVRGLQSVINESKVNEEKEREVLAENVSGRGNTVSKDRLEIVKESVSPTVETVEGTDSTLSEAFNQADLEQMRRIAGVTNKN